MFCTQGKALTFTSDWQPYGRPVHPRIILLDLQLAETLAIFCSQDSQLPICRLSKWERVIVEYWRMVRDNHKVSFFWKITKCKKNVVKWRIYSFGFSLHSLLCYQQASKLPQYCLFIDHYVFWTTYQGCIRGVQAQVSQAVQQMLLFSLIINYYVLWTTYAGCFS